MRGKVDRAAGSTAVIVIYAALALTMNGCSYAIVLSPSAAEGEVQPIPEQEIENANEVVSRIACELGLQPSADLATLENVGAEIGHRVLAAYARDPDLGDDWSKVLLITYVDERRQFIVLLRDWSSVRETEFTRALRQRLISDLGPALSGRQIDVRRLHDTPILYVP